jgi:hypothetical protein
MKIIGDYSPIIMGKKIKCVKNKNWIRMKQETNSTNKETYPIGNDNKQSTLHKVQPSQARSHKKK